MGVSAAMAAAGLCNCRGRASKRDRAGDAQNVLHFVLHSGSHLKGISSDMEMQTIGRNSGFDVFTRQDPKAP